MVSLSKTATSTPTFPPHQPKKSIPKVAPPRARQRPQRPAQQGHEVTEPVKAATRSRLRGEEGDAQKMRKGKLIKLIQLPSPGGVHDGLDIVMWGPS